MIGRSSRRLLLGLALACALLASLTLAALPASALATTASPWWRLGSRAAPSYLAPGGEGRIIAIASNVGDAPLITNATPLTITDELPTGLKLAAALKLPTNEESGNVTPYLWIPGGSRATLKCTVESAKQLSCNTEAPWSGAEPVSSVTPYDRVELTIPVEVEIGAASGEQNTVTVSGGQAPGGAPGPTKSLQRLVTVKDEATPFGVEDYELAGEEQGGLPDVQAGSHPFQLTTFLRSEPDARDGLRRSNSPVHPDLSPRASLQPAAGAGRRHPSPAAVPR